MMTLNLTIRDHISLLLKQVADAYVYNMTASREIESTKDALSDEALVEAIVLRGSQQHFRMLLARYKTRVHHLALSVLGPSKQAQAEDVAQEIFLKLYQRLDSFRGDCKFSTWLHRIAINTAIDYQRKNKRFEASDIDEVVLPESLITGPIQIEDRDTIQRLQKAINGLPHSQRMMVYQFYWLGMKTREIAEVLGCPEGTVKVYLRRARTVLAGQLENHSGE
jgi:RNA polymerase sigma-70 factor (ECF subfamily)